jgi:uncharacterized peroxidase-related enzyme
MLPPRIRIVQEADAKGETAELYESLRDAFKLPFVPDIMKTVSIRPDFLRVMHDGYRAMFLGGVLPRDVKEMIATLVSRTNSCEYCTAAHSLMLTAAGGGSREAAQACEVADVEAIPVDEKYRGLLRLSVELTKHAYSITDADIDALRTDGLADDEIIEGVFVACQFNAINRLADTFGVHTLGQWKE